MHYIGHKIKLPYLGSFFLPYIKPLPRIMVQTV